MSSFPQEPLCTVCAGSDFYLDSRFPHMKYCKQHGIGMQRYDFTQFARLFSAIARIRFVVDMNQISEDRLVYEGIDLTLAMKEVVDAYDALKGHDLAEQEYLEQIKRNRKRKK